jgi:hypothetical protein
MSGVPGLQCIQRPHLTAVDPDTDEVVPLFNPRTENWEDHFEWLDARIVGRTAVGRATVRLLRMNNEERLDMRMELQARGEHAARQARLDAETGEH